jgi:type VI secretion system secreted protein VgrG
VAGLVRTRDYNYRTATTPMDSAVTVRNNATTTGEHYRYAAPFLEAGDDGTPEPETESGAFYARIHHERELNKSAKLHLFSNAAHLTPGRVLEADGGNLNDLKEGVVITLTTYSAARDSRLHVSVWGMPYSEQFCFRPAEIPRPKMNGTLPARIESREKDDIYAPPDTQGRYQYPIVISLLLISLGLISKELSVLVKINLISMFFDVGLLMFYIMMIFTASKSTINNSAIKSNQDGR